MIRRILKRLFPARLLKDAFLIYNKLKILTIDKILFREYTIRPDQFHVCRQGYPFRECAISLDDLPEDEGKNYMLSWFDWTQEEFILSLNVPLWIEPEHGWGIVAPNKLVYYSLGVSRTWFLTKPSILAFMRRRSSVHLPHLISLRDTGEENYFHFFNDVLSKIFFLKKEGLLADRIPVVISQKLWKKPYFQFYLNHSNFLKSLNWFVQSNEYIACEKAVFCKPLTNRKDLWNLMLSSFDFKADLTNDRRIFLTRSKSRLRFVENTDEIESICRQQGLDIVDADKLTPEQQVELFSKTSMIVGLHGAGMTNMIFSGPGCKILEIFAPPSQGYLPYHYIMLAKTSGFTYRMVMGDRGRGRFSGGFHLDGKLFLEALKELYGQK